MGTSKGYIPPTRIQWSQAKLAVSQMLRDGDSASVAKAASKYATAMRADATSGSTFTNAVTGVLRLSRNIASHGVPYALNQINRADLLGRPSEEIWDELFNEYTHNGATTEDTLASDALSKALINLNINDLEGLGNVSQEALLKELLIEYVAINFDFRFAEKIGKGRSPADARRILNEMQDYIRSNLYENISFKDISNVNFSALSGSQYIDNALDDAYLVFDHLYTEE